MKTYLHHQSQVADSSPTSATKGDEGPSDDTAPPTPICDRCHDLVHSHRGVPIDHPSIEDIAESIAESPYRRNHVYHVLDAADFPMSLMPSIHSDLSLAKPRSQNRRSQHDYTVRPTMSFIITRSDLLAPTREKVDALLPYFQALIRDALGRRGEKMRLGNVHLVSAKRGWWTKELKKELWERGGGNWMVGKFNVGKSNLFEVIFPKGSGDRAPVYAELQKQQAQPVLDHLPESQLLPPAQPEVPFPTLPLVSSLPGTTASPIRLPFGNKKGELIDMPGLERGDLSRYVSSPHKLDLVMENRPKVEQHVIKPGQSLLLGGGVVRITPVLETGDDRTVVLAYPFVPLKAHVTATEKAIGTQTQERESGIESILAPGIDGSDFKSAGVFEMAKDVTKLRAGPVIRAGIKPDRLPFRIFSTDILIQGVGWVELVCQVRRRSSTSFKESTSSENPAFDSHGLETITESPSTFKPWVPASEADFELPRVEIFTPKGEHISSRPPMNAWTIQEDGTSQKTRIKGAKPRRPISFKKAVEERRAGRMA